MRFALLAFVCTAGCANGADTGAAEGSATDMAPSNPLVAARPFEYDVPQNYDGRAPTPLVIVLHGYGADGYIQTAYFGINKLVDKYGFLLAYPDGTWDSQHMRFWNATDACCDFDHRGIDDVAYVNAVIDDMSAHFNVDKKRIFLTGHSNGAFMSHRYACDHAERIAAIVALAGDDWKDESKCQPREPVAVLQVHGDMDESVPYAGDATTPSAHDSVAGWAKKNGCTQAPTDTSAPPRDLVGNIAGAETTIERWTGCGGGAAELWTLRGAPHLPDFKQPDWPEAVCWFAAHPKR